MEEAPSGRRGPEAGEKRTTKHCFFASFSEVVFFFRLSIGSRGEKNQKMFLIRFARKGNSLALLACGSAGGPSAVSSKLLGTLEAHRSAESLAAPAMKRAKNSHRRRAFASAAAGANLDGVNPATLRAEAASALAESDDDGLDDFGGPSFP